MSAVKELTVSFLRRYFLLILKNVIKYPHGIVCSIAFSAHNHNMTENHPLHKPKPNVFIMQNVRLLPFFKEKKHFHGKIHISIKHNWVDKFVFQRHRQTRIQYMDLIKVQHNRKVIIELNLKIFCFWVYILGKLFEKDHKYKTFHNLFPLTYETD